jgi:uncharacterized protein (DUF58 family)
VARSEFKIEKAFLERLERLSIHWNRSFPGVVGGHNASRYSGSGQEFLDHRNFYSGDDLRAVNWRAYMRLEKLFLKLFQIEPRVPIRLFIDASASMGLGDKWDFTRRLTAALVYVGLVRLDAIQLIPFRDTLEEGLACGGGRHRFSPVADYLAALKPEGKSDFARVAREFLSGDRQRGLAIIISDFLGEDDWIKPLQFLADFGHELTLIQIWNDDERTPNIEGDLEITEVETGKQLKLNFDASAREQYTQAFDEYAATLRKLAFRNQGRYNGLPTSSSIEDAVFGALIATQGVR